MLQLNHSVSFVFPVQQYFSVGLNKEGEKKKLKNAFLKHIILNCSFICMQHHLMLPKIGLFFQQLLFNWCEFLETRSGSWSHLWSPIIIMATYKMQLRQYLFQKLWQTIISDDHTKITEFSCRQLLFRSIPAD